MIDRKEDNQFHLVSKYEPSGDQPQAIEALVDNIEGGEKAQILKGATGTGKTYTMSQVIQRVNKPTLVIAHNKTLAGQLYGEFKEFFPDNAVEYFVSYYDFYQPEAYVPSSDTYIEKDSSVNDEIDKLRHSATSALLERNDVTAHFDTALSASTPGVLYVYEQENAGIEVSIEAVIDGQHKVLTKTLEGNLKRNTIYTVTVRKNAIDIVVKVDIDDWEPGEDTEIIPQL